MLRITNHNDFDLIDRYDGQDYYFPKGKTVRCPEAVAVHVFGIGNPDKVPYLARQGWLRASGDFDKAMAVLNKFAFEVVEEKYDEEFALIEQRKSPSAPAEAAALTGADDPANSSASAPKRNILKRLESAHA